MTYLVDTNVFLRLVSRNDPDRNSILDALRNLGARNEDLFYTSQVLGEFWAVCTRPSTARGGLRPFTRRDGKKGPHDRALLPTPSRQSRHSSRMARLIVTHSSDGSRSARRPSGLRLANAVGVQTHPLPQVVLTGAALHEKSESHPRKWVGWFRSALPSCSERIPESPQLPLVGFAKFLRSSFLGWT
jgi:predicted nucleic acid-binding protein